MVDEVLYTCRLQKQEYKRNRIFFCCATHFRNFGIWDRSRYNLLYAKCIIKQNIYDVIHILLTRSAFNNSPKISWTAITSTSHHHSNNSNKNSWKNAVWVRVFFLLFSFFSCGKFRYFCRLHMIELRHRHTYAMHAEKKDNGSFRSE